MLLGLYTHTIWSDMFVNTYVNICICVIRSMIILYSFMQPNVICWLLYHTHFILFYCVYLYILTYDISKCFYRSVDHILNFVICHRSSSTRHGSDDSSTGGANCVESAVARLIWNKYIYVHILYTYTHTYIYT